VLPEHLRAEVKKDALRVLPIFKLMSEHVAEDEMYRAFNMGVGMILVVKPEDVDAVLAEVSDAYLIGEIVEGARAAVMI
jgi:phosphoribosylformylglycinamidine cyclo-ligase